MTQEQKEQLRKDAARLWGCESISANKDMLNILSECLFKVFYEHANEPVYFKAEAEAKIVVQMIFTKTLHLRKMLDGISFQSREGKTLNNIIDPTAIAAVVRTFFETIAMFNLVYIAPQKKDERVILYNLWVIAGLKFRQRFVGVARSPESKKKQADELDVINNLTTQIKQTALYQSLNSANKNKIDQKIKEKDFKIQFDNLNVKHLSWHDIIPVMGIREDLMGQMYTYFSLYAHPSNVAVFQFADLFNPKDEAFIQMTNFNILNVVKLISCFIADYIKMFPTALKIFESLPLIDQIAINYHNKFLRVDKSLINNAMSALD